MYFYKLLGLSSDLNEGRHFQSVFQVSNDLTSITIDFGLNVWWILLVSNSPGTVDDVKETANVKD